MAGKVREFFSAQGAPPTGYEPHVLLPWATIFSNKDPGNSGTPWDWAAVGDFFGKDGTDKTFNIASELYALREEEAGNPYAGVAAYDPTALVGRVEDALDRMSDALESGGATLAEYVAEAMEQANVVMPDDNIDDLLDAMEERSLTDHQQAVSRTLVALWLDGGVNSTVAGNRLAMLEDGRARTLAEQTAKLRLIREDQRSQLAVQMLQVGVSWRDRDVTFTQALISSALDSLRIVTTIEQDRRDKDVEYVMAERFYNLGLLQEALMANSAMYGAAVTPRGQTRGERLAAALSGSVSMGIQGGTALGNPAAGVALGGANFLMQMLLG
jgi:hypothetical protein